LADRIADAAASAGDDGRVHSCQTVGCRPNQSARRERVCSPDFGDLVFTTNPFGDTKNEEKALTEPKQITHPRVARSAQEPGDLLYGCYFVPTTPVADWETRRVSGKHAFCEELATHHFRLWELTFHCRLRERKTSEQKQADAGVSSRLRRGNVRHGHREKRPAS